MKYSFFTVILFVLAAILFSCGDDLHEIKRYNKNGYKPKQEIGFSGKIDSMQKLNAIASSSPELKNAHKLFRANCASCHSLTMRMVGPALGNTKDSIPVKTEKYVLALFMRTDSLRKTKDPYYLRQIGKRPPGGYYSQQKDFHENFAFLGKTEAEELAHYIFTFPWNQRAK